MSVERKIVITTCILVLMLKSCTADIELRQTRSEIERLRLAVAQYQHPADAQ